MAEEKTDMLIGTHDQGRVDAGEALSALFMTPTTRERYRDLAGRAAYLEREGQYRQAQRLWLQALSFALCSLDRHWCDARAAWCGRQTTVKLDAGCADKG
ncbi:ANR family transcriptional regulator [Serratia nevei]|uniref:ANR family transcriptional regulator n=1 Tax=Serratia nevei TaxID=2703794 RepID=UPI00313DB190